MTSSSSTGQQDSGGILVAVMHDSARELRLYMAHGKRSLKLQVNLVDVL